jgi:hypothetical protein
MQYRQILSSARTSMRSKRRSSILSFPNTSKVGVGEPDQEHSAGVRGYVLNPACPRDGSLL